MNQNLSALRSVNSNLYAMKEYFETRPVYLELKNKYFGKEKFKEEHKKEISGILSFGKNLKREIWMRMEKYQKENGSERADRLSEEIAVLRKRR